MADLEVILVEDHDEALKLWRSRNVRGLDLVHLDAHMDFAPLAARPIERLVNEARNLKDLKKKLEFTLNFLRYEKDLSKQTNIGNYIYPAMEEGIVDNFYWVIPGKSKEFKKSCSAVKSILKQITRFENAKKVIKEDKFGRISVPYLGRKIIVCNLESLPRLSKNILLDIDVDFLIIDSILNAKNTDMIGKRKPWISPQDLLSSLKEKLKAPKITSISYSTNGGWTPFKYRHFGDELAYGLAPLKFKRRFEISRRAARYFGLFESTGKGLYYSKAIKLNSIYRSKDNNYGSLYLSKGKFSSAQKEFNRILKVDASNAGAVLGLGEISLQRKDFKKARRYFSSVFLKRDAFALWGLARAEFGLGNFKKAKGLLIRYQDKNRLQPYSYYLLGLIFEKEKEFDKAALFLKDAIRLGYNSIEALRRLLKISFYLYNKDAIIKFIFKRYKLFKSTVIGPNRFGLKKRKQIKSLEILAKKMMIFEEKLKKEALNAEEGGFKKE